MTRFSDRRRAFSFGSARNPDAVIAMAIGLLVFALRWLTIDFDNEAFMHLSWAVEMLRGQMPLRDFVEPGVILQTLLSYVALRLGGYRLLGEAVVACGFFAASASLCYLICRRLAFPRWLAIAIVVIAAASFPRVYAYPKAFVYPAAVLAALRYAEVPNRRRLAVLAGATALAFLFRQDHGLYVFVFAALTLAMLHVSRPRIAASALLRYAMGCVLFVTPYLIWVGASGQNAQYWSFVAERSDGLLSGLRVATPSFEFDRTAAPVAFAAIDYPIVRVRWAGTTPADVRHRLEEKYGLERHNGDDDREQTLSYRLREFGRDNVAQIVADPAVEDTQGIDRGSLRAPAGLFPWLYLHAQRLIPPIRLRILPGVIRRSNALPWLSYSFILAALVVLTFECGRALTRGRVETGAAGSVAIAVLSLIMFVRLVRESPDSRLGDVAAVSAPLVGWVVLRGWTAIGKARAVLRPAVLAVLMLTMAAALSYGRPVARLAAAGVDGPTNIARRTRDVALRYSQRPLETFSPPGATGLARLSRWINACTLESDRVAVIGFEPQVFVLAERGMAGGMGFYDVAWYGSVRDQQLTIQRWATQSVPIVLAMTSEWTAFNRDYPLVRDWLETRYEHWRTSTFGGNKEIQVWIEKARVAGLSRQEELPCFIAATP